uniref:Reverse transcriptase domain-containing protein n=1 Tax=Tanacetum cinerariifolium TaxID=118510 RepID=A0A6L2KWY1_TANCI|nr:reverse transcriptase domain-containing protein [Tanacetum cinerariifolium]
MTGVTGDKHLCSGTVSSGQKKKVDNECLDCCFVIRGDRCRCVKNGRKGSVKAGGFGFGSLAVEKKRYKRVALFSWSVERPLGTSLIGKREEVVGPGGAEMVVNVSNGMPCKHIIRDTRRKEGPPHQPYGSATPKFPRSRSGGGGSLSDKGRTELCALLKRNLDIFAWQPSDMTGDCLTAVNGGVMVFSVGRCHGGVPVKMTGVTGDKHLCFGTVDNECLDCCFVIRGDRRRCVKNGRKGTVKAGGFGFGSLAVERKRYKWWLCFLGRWRASWNKFDREKVVGPGRAEMVVNVSNGVPW